MCAYIVGKSFMVKIIGNIVPSNVQKMIKNINNNYFVI